MSRRASLHLQQDVTNSSNTSVHHIIIETRHLAGDGESTTTYVSDNQNPSSNDRRLSIAALQLLDEIDQQQQHHPSPSSQPTSRRSSMSHHIIVETPNSPGGRNSSNIIVNTPGMTDYTTYAPSPRAADFYSNRFFSSSTVINNRSSMPPDTVLEESEFDIMSYEKGKTRAYQSGVDDDYEECMQDSCSCHHHRQHRCSQTCSDTPSPEPTNSHIDGVDDPKKEEANKGNKWKQYMKRIRAVAISYFIKYWFLLGLGLMIGLAWRFPDLGKTHGLIQAQYTVKWGCVIIIFLLSGLGLDVRVMFKTFLQWRLHLVVQAINFLAMPFLMYGIVLIFITSGASLNTDVYKGWMIALSTSTTVSSNVVMTRNAKGNDGAALFNAALGNVMGIFACPALMSVFQQDPRVFPPGTPRGNPDYLNVLKTLGFTVLLPLVVGQIIRFYFPDPIKKTAAKLRFPIINNIALLFLVWSVFCDGVASHAFDHMSAVDIVAMIFVDIFMYLFGCGLCLFVARVPWPFAYEPRWIKKWRFSRQDSVAIMYCGATKTVSMGIPLINVIYSSSSYGVVGVLSLPLLMYHVMQLFLGNVQVQMLKNWIQKHPPPPIETNEKHQQTMDEQEIINDNISSHDPSHHPPKPVLPVFVSSSPSHLNRHSQISQYSGIEANSSTATVSASTVYSGMNRNNNHY
ncbi:hypothetical protein O0I10_007998 [Lichtheimia ornata]|uniref:Sodium bile acid symporter family protein n=1 Tax=Lichtheimia ornata TaxID=688661 RepID=A0AAD7V019_9FUNG|nr:uncharacterized protein O0I10_007998 [Lichtheimia ornata]KAJ8656204.1 hypothetical protein O0I10_007998 [Lichtheimia ornata]